MQGGLEAARAAVSVVQHGAALVADPTTAAAIAGPTRGALRSTEAAVDTYQQAQTAQLLDELQTDAHPTEVARAAAYLERQQPSGTAWLAATGVKLGSGLLELLNPFPGAGAVSAVMLNTGHLAYVGRAVTHAVLPKSTASNITWSNAAAARRARKQAARGRIVRQIHAERLSRVDDPDGISKLASVDPSIVGR